MSIKGLFVKKSRYYSNRVTPQAWVVVLGLVLAAALFLSAIVVGVTWGDRITCRNKADTIDLPYRWSMSAGCNVRVDGQYIPIDQVRVTYVTQ